MIQPPDTPPNTAEDWFNHGVALSSQNKPDEAADAYRKGAAFTDELPVVAACCINLGGILLNLREIDEAIQVARRAVSLDPSNITALLLYGSTLRFGGHSEDAVAYYKAAIETNPDYRSLWSEIALIRTSQGRYLEALQLVQSHANEFSTDSLEYKTLLEVTDICLNAAGHAAPPIVSNFRCPDRVQTAQMWQDFYEDSADFRRIAPIVCVGDSHAAFFTGLHTFQYLWPEPTPQWLPHVSGQYVASALAYSLNRPNSSMRGIERLQKFVGSPSLVRGGTVMLSFGEIDLRNHVIEQSRSQGRPVSEIVDDCVTGYKHAVEVTRAAGHRPMIWAPPPSRADSGPFPQMFPTTGSEVERNQATRYFIAAMRAAMEPMGVPVISIFDEMVDESLRSDGRYFMDSCHLNMAATPLAIAALRKGIGR